MTRVDCAVLGLGAMGLPMVQRLTGCMEVAAYDPDSTRAELATRSGISVSDSVAAAVRECSAVLLAVRTSEQVDALLVGKDGLIENLAPRVPVILTSTVGRDSAEKLSSLVGSAGHPLVDAPISGGKLRARSGELLITIGADPAAVESVRPILSALASHVVVVGSRPGDGQSMKTVNQLLCGVHVAAASEALALAQVLDLDPERALEALLQGAAQSFMLQDRGPRIVEQLCGESPSVASRTDIFVKDLALVLDAARQAGLEIPTASGAEQLFSAANQRGWGGDDDSTLVRLVLPEEGAATPDANVS